MYVKEVDHVGSFTGSLDHVQVRYEVEIDYQRHGSALKMVLALDDIADAIWTLNDDEMPKQEKEKARESVKVLKGIFGGLPQGTAEGIASQVAQRLLGG
jgi:hypothetical protein